MGEMDQPFILLVIAALALFWIGMLGLLWRRSLVGMLVGVLFGWISVAVGGIAFVGLRPASPGAVEDAAQGAAFALCVMLVCALQVALGLSIVVARIARRGTLDAQDAGLLEG